MTLTNLENLVDPQVVATIIEANLPAAIKLFPLAAVDTTLVGQPGSTLTLPAWDYIGDATEVGEGKAIDLSTLGQKTAEVAVKKVAKGFEITDEAVLSGIGDPINEGARQLVLSIASKVDNDLVDELAKATLKSKAATGLTVEAIAKAQDLFDDEDSESMVLLASPEAASELRVSAAKEWLSGTEIGANRITSGVYGEILGAQVIRTRRLKAKNKAYLVKKGALKIILKRDTAVERDRDIIKKTTVVTADKHYAAYLYDASKVVEIDITKA